MIGRPAVRLAVAAALLFPCSSAAFAAMQQRIDAGAFAALDAPPASGRIDIENVPLVDGLPETLELEQFEVWAPDAEIEVFGANDEVLARLAPPRARYYQGRVAGRPESLVFLAVSGRRIEGLIWADDRKFAVGSRAVGRDSIEIIVHESSETDENAERGFKCGVEQLKVRAAARPHAVTNAAGEPVVLGAPTGTQRSLIHLAIETDYELFTSASASAANVTTFIGNLVGATSTIYERDILTQVRLSYLGVHTVQNDPFYSFDIYDQLNEIGDRWHNAPPTQNPRTAVALISGKATGGGIAWLQTLCGDDFSYDGHWGGRYSVSADIDVPADESVPNPDANPPSYTAPASNSWPLVVFTHELGHNVGSEHTHCVALSPAQKTQYNVTRNYVDECWSGEDIVCFNGTPSVPAEKGTLMSYCDLLGDMTLLRFTLGQPNEPSEVIRLNMRSYMAGVTPPLSSITAPASLGPGVSGTASVGAAAGMTYSWSITNGTFTGGGTTATGASVTFSGTVNPVTLKVIGTTSQGCAITDSKSVTIGTPLAAPANALATGNGAASIDVTWSAVSGATGYEVHRSTGGGAFTLAGTSATTSFNDTAVAANTSYLYKVRAMNGTAPGTFSGADAATAIAFTDPALPAQSTVVRAAHIGELRAGANALRALAGLDAFTFTDTIASGLQVKRLHVTELRTAIDEARSLLGQTGLVYESITAQSTSIKASHLSQLRGGLQ